MTNIFQTGFRGNVFFVDDIFIWNRKKLKEDLLPEIIKWNEAHKHPFNFTTEASINLADDSELMELMARAGFIQKSGIVTAMVDLLNAPNNTSGDNTNYFMNFIPTMNKEILLNDYKSIIKNIYSKKAYDERLIHFLSHFNPRMTAASKITLGKLLALFRSVFYLGVLSKGRFYYWKLFFWSLLRKPRLFPMAITYSIYGYHFRKIFGIVS